MADTLFARLLDHVFLAPQHAKQPSLRQQEDWLIGYNPELDPASRCCYYEVKQEGGCVAGRDLGLVLCGVPLELGLRGPEAKNTPCLLCLRARSEELARHLSRHALRIHMDASVCIQPYTVHVGRPCGYKSTECLTRTPDLPWLGYTALVRYRPELLRVDQHPLSQRARINQEALYELTSTHPHHTEWKHWIQVSSGTTPWMRLFGMSLFEYYMRHEDMKQ